MRKSSSRISKIAVWGPPSSGKTVFLTIFKYLINSDELLKDRYEWKTHFIAGDSEKELGNNFIGLTNRENALHPRKTEELTQYEFQISGYGPRFGLGRLQANIHWGDYPGEAFLQPSDFIDDIKDSDAILVFLDPILDPNQLAKSGQDFDNIPDNASIYYYAGLEELISITQNKSPLPIFAFVVSKIDEERSLWEMRNLPQLRLLQEAIGEMGASLVKKQCKKWKVFASTSVGAILDESGVYLQSNMETIYNERFEKNVSHIRDLAHFKPVNVYEPIMWLLEELKMRRLKRR